MTKIALPILAFVFLITSPVYARGKDRIAVAAERNTVAGEVSKVAARSPYFLIFDETGALLEAVQNPYKAARKKASASVVPFLAQKGVTMIVAGEFGENMLQNMKRPGIKALEFRGSVEGAIKMAMESRKQHQ